MLAGVNRILVIKFRHLGDVLLTSPVFRLLKERFPNSVVDGLIYKDSKAMLEGNSSVSDLLLYDRGWKQLGFAHRLGKELGLLREIRRRRYDLVLNLTEGDRGAIATLASGARLRVGIDPGRSGFFGKRKIYTHLVRPCQSPRHAVERNLDALRVLGLHPELHERNLEFHVPEEAFQKVTGWQNCVVVHPVSRWLFKCPEPSLVARLVCALRDRGERVVLTAGPDPKELERIEHILQGCRGEGIYSLAGLLSLKELGALYQGAKALITVDSVPLHIASALKVPVVALFGPTSEQNWGPWNHPKAQVVTSFMSCRPCYLDGCGGSKRSDCLDRLSIGSILRAYEEVSAETSSLLRTLNSFATPNTE